MIIKTFFSHGSFIDLYDVIYTIDLYDVISKNLGLGILVNKDSVPSYLRIHFPLQQRSLVRVCNKRDLCYLYLNA